PTASTRWPAAHRHRRRQDGRSRSDDLRRANPLVLGFRLPRVVHDVNLNVHVLLAALGTVKAPVQCLADIHEAAAETFYQSRHIEVSTVPAAAAHRIKAVVVGSEIGQCFDADWRTVSHAPIEARPGLRWKGSADIFSKDSR